MKKLTYEQLCKMDKWITNNARAYDRAKWEYLFHNGAKEKIVEEMLKYQNADGGFGNGFEPDILSPLSAAIPSAEAIFQSYDYDLDCNQDWFKKLLSYFEKSIKNIPKYWEDFPKEILNYPHPPYWNYETSISFSPNPCAVVASAMIRYGTEAQIKLGYNIAKKCLEFLKSDSFCGDHDTLNILALFKQLLSINSPLITQDVYFSLEKRIIQNVCFDSSRWCEYVFQPLDFISSYDSVGYDFLKHGIENNINFWINTINEEGVWSPNFSWGIDDEIANQVTKIWKGYIAVKRAKILLSFNMIEFKDKK